MAILQAERGHTHALRLMNQTSVLGRYLWVFRAIVGQMQHDLFHVYTVDQHILMVLRNVRRFFIPEHAHEYPFCSQLASQWDAPTCFTSPRSSTTWPGAAGRPPDLGAVDVRRFCRAAGRRRPGWLAPPGQHHLTMSRVAQKEGSLDPR